MCRTLNPVQITQGTDMRHVQFGDSIVNGLEAPGDYKFL